MEQTQTLQRENPLGYRPVGKLLRQFALPSVISMLVNAVYNIVDQIFIGQSLGLIGNGATVVALPLVSILLAVSTLLGAGGSAYAAIKLGEKDEREAERSLGTIFTLLIFIGILLMTAGLIFLKPIMYLFGSTDTILPYAMDYSGILLLGAPFNMLGVALSNMARTDGNPNISMYSMVAGAVLNTILDPIYIFVFHWGIKGAAIATITSQIVSAAILMWYFLRKSHLRLHLHDLVPVPRICKKVFALGLSSCFTQLASTLLQIVMNNSLKYYGDLSAVGSNVAVTAVGIVMKVSMILIAVDIGIGIGSQPILGFNQGARKPKRIRKTYLLATGIATTVSIVGWLACILIPNILLILFGTQDAQFTAFAVKSMRIFMGGVFCAGFQIVSTSYFQATGQPLKASILSLLRQIIFLIPLILILPLFMGLDGILWAGPIADICAGIVVLFFILHEMKKLNRWIRETEDTSEQPMSAPAADRV